MQQSDENLIVYGTLAAMFTFAATGIGALAVGAFAMAAAAVHHIEEDFTRGAPASLPS